MVDEKPMLQDPNYGDSAEIATGIPVDEICALPVGETTGAFHGAPPPGYSAIPVSESSESAKLPISSYHDV